MIYIRLMVYGYKFIFYLSQVFWLRVGVIGGAPEQKVEGYVWQADTKGIKASWLTDDPQSGIAGYTVAVGTSPGQ